MTDRQPATLDLPHVQALVRDALTSVLGDALSIELGFPHCHDDGRLRNAGPAPAALVALALTPAAPSGGPWLWLTAALAADAVDRALGGDGHVGVASSAALLSDEECGVLAYLAAKAARPFPGLWVRDVIATTEPPPRAALVWPITLRWEGGSGNAFLGWPPVAPTPRAPCQIGWYDGLSVADETALVVGDVLLSDEIPVSLTTEGLSGHGVLRANGLADTLQVALDGTRLEGHRSERRAARSEGVFVVLHLLFRQV